jgi:hypothetical protein
MTVAAFFFGYTQAPRPLAKSSMPADATKQTELARPLLEAGAHQ